MTKEPPVYNDSIACVAKKRADEEEKANDIAEVLEVGGTAAMGVWELGRFKVWTNTIISIE